MSWRTFMQCWQECSNSNASDLADIFERLANADPDLYWYPGSGWDLTPLVLDTPNNPTEKRLFPLRGPKQTRELLLWMNDYSGDSRNEPEEFDLECPSDATDAIQEKLRVAIGVEEPIGSFTIPTNPRTQEQPVPVTVFQIRVTGGTGNHRRPTDGDTYTVLFSRIESEVLVRQVFVPNKIPVRVVALQRQGGFSGQRAHFGLGDFEQYRDVPRLLQEHEPELGQVEAYLFDRDDMKIAGYHANDKFMPDWGVHGTRMWVPNQRKDSAKG